jgi:hypothetical protein
MQPGTVINIFLFWLPVMPLLMLLLLCRRCPSTLGEASARHLQQPGASLTVVQAELICSRLHLSTTNTCNAMQHTYSLGRGSSRVGSKCTYQIFFAFFLT